MTGFFAPRPTVAAAPAQPREVPPECPWRQVVRQDLHPLPHHATAARAARRHAQQMLTDWGVEEEEIFDTLLVVSELVTNAVEHALPPIALQLKVTSAADGTVRLHADVFDGGPALRDGAWTSSCAADERGRGRQIVAALAEGTVARRCDHGADYGATLRPLHPGDVLDLQVARR